MEWTRTRIRLFREVGLCLSQDEFATMLGFAKRTVGNAERGTHPPSLALRRALDRTLERAPDAQRERFLAALGERVDTARPDSTSTGLTPTAGCLRPCSPLSSSDLSAAIRHSTGSGCDSSVLKLLSIPLRNHMSGCERADSVEFAPTLKGRYRGLVLDFGGVLTTSFEGALRSYCIRDGLAPEALGEYFNLDQGAQGELVDLERGRISQDQFVAHIAPALGVDPDGLLERMSADLRSEPLVVEVVARLRSRGIKIAVLSNSWGSTPFDPYARFQLREHYDVVVISDQVGLRKPDPEIFVLTLNQLELPGEQCVYVDDVARYLPAARALGMATIHAIDPVTTVTELERIFGGGTSSK